MPQANKTRRARNKLRKELRLTMKQLKKRKILKDYDYANGALTLSINSPGGQIPGGQVSSSAEMFNKLQGAP